jgi:ZIP family zinc transporter
MSEIVIRHYARPARRRPLWVGIAMAVVALAFAVEQSAHWLAANPLAARGLQASLLAGLATGLGALPVLFLKRPSEGWTGPLLGVAGGMMLAAAFFSLALPALEAAATSTQPLLVGGAAIAAGLAGALAMQALDQRTRHAHVEDVGAVAGRPQLALVVAAIAIHNLPEGLAVGAAVSAGVDHGMSLGIALQNIPEGWIVASALVVLGAGPWKAAVTALATGLVEPVGGLFGALAGTLAGAALPLVLAAAAGAMIWVVLHELAPAALRGARRLSGATGLAGGFAVMSALAFAA